MGSTKKSHVTFEHDEEEDNVPDRVHENLLENVRQIHGKPKITPATRTEPISAKKKTKSGRSTFREADLIQSIKKKKPSIAQKLEATKKTKTLSKPLETVYEKRAEREAGYQNVKTRLNAWTDIVTSNRVADQLVFPLKSKEIEVYDHTDGGLFSSFSKLTPLEQEFQKVLNASETSKEEEKKLENSKFRVSLREMMEKRKAFAKMKAQASYQIAKSRRQNKIKSKKYHRILRREKIKQQMKDFELLHKTDPEAALKQLQQLEKSRAQERATLRHRNTGKWARNQMIKAKYNKESRQALSEQLAKNRELTEKKVVESSDSDSGDDETFSSVRADPDEPWLGGSNYNEFVTSYQKWKEGENQSKCNDKSFEVSEITLEDSKRYDKSFEVSEITSDCLKCDDKSFEVSEITSPVDDSRDSDEEKVLVEAIPRSSTKSKKTPGKTSKCQSFPEIRNSSGVWTVTCISYSDESIPEDGPSRETDVSEMFDTLESRLNEKCLKKLKEVLDAEVTPTQKSQKTKKRKRGNKDTSFAGKKKPRDEDIGLAVQSKQIPENKQPEPLVSTLDSELPDFMVDEDEAMDDEETDAERQHRMTISEAFADEDVVAEFQEEKQKTEDDDKPQIINPSLPGWGSWVDAASLHKKETKKLKHRRTNKRFLFKIPKAPPRKDANKGFVITKEGIDDKLKEHMVSEVPYPFTKVKDFEAHIRAPIGRTWLPETAHQQLIAPAVITKLGTVIEPMDEGELVRRETL